MTIDPELVTRKLLLIAADLAALGPIRARGADAYLQNWIDQAVVERYLERMVGRMIDVNYHVITGSGHPPPADYHASFVRLAEIGVLDPAFAKRIARSAGLRNRLVHDYEGLDHSKVFAALVEALEDVPQFLDRINSHIA
ncbi:hypothetical protein LuPra_00027 [Luteitalea pratensis]|uniref:DUF86 domain-containing protein n=1 Tax=Luteitalea pratensis TaxID=1855912 RepID=A0A143PE93_LUTPR|nr:DUF86 domain-containing protein [Luteitalea pratensis]AMY06867.1 hypothetical protein LuPra_00027 [Luteitalea pratensis]